MGRVPRRAEPWHLAPARVTTGAPTERGVTPARPMRAHGSTTGWSAGSRAWTAPTDSVILARRFHGIWLVYISAPLNRQRGYVRAAAKWSSGDDYRRHVGPGDRGQPWHRAGTSRGGTAPGRGPGVRR